MSLDALHVAIAAALLAAPAGLGVATYTDTLEESFAADAVEVSSAEAETVESFEGEVPEDVTAGNLDLRIDRGIVKVVGWEKDTYKLDVLVADEETSADEGETETTFDETIEEDTISLSLVVDHQSATHAQVETEQGNVGDTAERAVVAHVPQRLTFETIHACEGEAPASETDLVSFGDEDCVETDQPTVMHAHINTDRDDEQGLDVTWGLETLEGEAAQLRADDGRVELHELSFAKLDVATDNGDVNGTDVTADELAVATDNGAIELAADADKAQLATDNGDIELDGDVSTLDASSDNGQIAVASPSLSEGTVKTDNGPIDMKIEPVRSGELAVASDNGAIAMHLGHGEDIGYHAVAQSDNGQVDVALVDEESSAEDEAEEETGPDNSETARTAGYDEKPIQLAIDAQTDNGAIEIVEESAEPSDDGSAGSGSAGLLQ